MTASREMTRLIRPVAAPLACAVVLTGLLSAWVATGGGGTLRRMPLQFVLAAVSSPQPGQSPHGQSAIAPAYLVIKNLAGPDELLSARLPASRQVVFARRGSHPFGTGATVTGLVIPGHSTTSLSPFGPDIVLIGPGAMIIGDTVPVTLTFRHAGQITVEFAITPSGTP
jgi:copper(I)-binding protein